MMQELPKVELHHMGLWVKDRHMMADFYCRLYGFHVSDRGRVRGIDFVFMTLDPNAHHQLVLASGRPDDVSFNVLNQILFRTESLANVRRFYQALLSEPVTGITPMTHGNAWSVYFQDPEGNRNEIFADTPWHVSQPLGQPMDMALPDDEIIRRTEALIRDNVTKKPFADWRRETATVMGRGD